MSLWSLPKPQLLFDVLTTDTVLFDLDGTLLDSVALILSSYRHTMEVHRGVTPPDTEWISGMGTPLWVQLREFARDDEQTEAMLQTYREHNLAHHDTMVREYAGVREALSALDARGVTMGIVSSKLRRGVLRGLRLCQLEEFFPVVVGADNVAKPKPDPEPITKALALLEADAKCTIFVGDSPHDIVAGRAAGVRTAAVRWGPFPLDALAAERPDYWVDAPSDLARLGLTNATRREEKGAIP